MWVAVAKAMGWTISKQIGPSFNDIFWVPPDGKSAKKGFYYTAEPPDYLNDIRAALTFVEFLRGKGLTFTISNGLDGHFEVSVYRGEECLAYVDNKSLPHAICEAGLKALGLYDGTEGQR
jgi:hypothetical protein